MNIGSENEYKRGFEDGKDEVSRITCNSRLDLTGRVFSVIIEEELTNGTSIGCIVKTFHTSLETARKNVEGQKAKEESGH